MDLSPETVRKVEQDLETAAKAKVTQIQVSTMKLMTNLSLSEG